MPKASRAIGKLTRPRLHAAVKRTRLFKLLDQRERYSIIWVNGPPGSGKTTLVASYLETLNAKTFWYQVDEGDRDPATFFHYLAELAKQSKSRKKTPLPILTADHLPDLAGFTRRFFRDFFSRLGAEAVLVLDNCQDASSETFHMILRDACEELPQGVFLVGLSRSTLPDEFARFVANQRVRDIGWDDLQLTLNETSDIAKLGRSETQALHEQCEGWVAGLVLLLANRGTTKPNQVTRPLKSKEVLFAYFAGEVFSKTAADTRALLIRTALFPYTTVSMAMELTTDSNADHILNSLFEKQYFIDRKADGELTYQYHDLFREFLLAKLAESYDQSSLNELLCRAAKILERNSHLNDAVALHRRAKDWANVGRIITCHAKHFVETGRWETVNEWFREFPDKLINDDPYLLLWRGESILPVNLSVARTFIDLAYHGFVKGQNDWGQCRAMSLLVSCDYGLGVSFLSLDPMFAPLESLIERRLSSLSDEEAVEAWSAYASIVIMRIGYGRFLDQAIDFLFASQTSSVLSTDAICLMAQLSLHFQMWMAKQDTGNSSVARLRELAVPGKLPPYSLVDTLRTVGYWYFWNAEYEKCLPFFEQASQFGKQYCFDGQVVACCTYRVVSLCQLGRLSEAQSVLDETNGIVPIRSPISAMYFGWASAHLAARKGKFLQALQLEDNHETSLLIAEVLIAARRAAYSLELGRTSDAFQCLNRSRQISKGAVWRYMDCFCESVEVEICLRTGNEFKAAAALKIMLNEAKIPRKAAMLTWIDHWLPRQFAVALEKDIEVETVHQLIRRFNVSADSPTNDAWPWPIKICAFGELLITIDNKPLVNRGKAQHKLLDLVRVIITSGAQQVSVDEISEWLWPDADGDVAAGNLRTSLHRLRKLLGRDDAIIVRDNKVSLNNKCCWLDVWAFEHCTSGQNGSVAIDQLEKAVLLYRGHLLEKESHAWVLPMRDRMRKRFQRAVLSLTRVWEKNGCAEEAEALYNRCLELDDSAELVYRQLMLHLKSRGRTAEALDVYLRCEAALRNNLATKPSPETRSIYEALRAEQ